MSKAIGLIIDGVIEWHASGPGVTDHDTLCGIDPDDERLGNTGTVSPSRGQKITCLTCKSMWAGVVALKLRPSDFA